MLTRGKAPEKMWVMLSQWERRRSGRSSPKLFLEGCGALGNTGAFPGRLGGSGGGALVFSRAPDLGDRVPYLGGDDRGPQPVPSIRARKRTDEPLRRRLQRGVGLAARPGRRSPLLAGLSGPLHPGTSTSNAARGEHKVLLGKARFAELAPEPILEPPLPGRTFSPFVSSRSRNIRLHQQPDTTGKRRACVDPRHREEYARGDLNPQPSAPEADALSS